MVDSSSPAMLYRVLARKYRPQKFSDLIGQDAMVRTLGNAIARDRLAHAFLLTGVRGVGKTSTARLIAKALNCVGRDGKGGMTIDPCGECEACRAIAEGRHIDVVEMDAASHTGVDDIRDIVESVRYASVSARFKVYIIDEVHMLSKSAFNALLKTLEEPPAHVKFLFATTEINKVPITVLSRCQRFDLRRISTATLTEYFTKVVQLEQVEAEEEALAMIAKAAEGSVRDGLSILDQAIAHSSGSILAADVREMLGLSDRGVIKSLLLALLEGRGDSVLDHVKAQYDLGVEPEALLHGLLQLIHAITRSKMGRPDNLTIHPTEEESWLAELGKKLSFPTLHRLWQLLLKGHQEVQNAVLLLEAAEMALLRVLHASQLPDPAAIIAQLKKQEALSSSQNSPPSSEDNRFPSLPSLVRGDAEVEDVKKKSFEYGNLNTQSANSPSRSNDDSHPFISADQKDNSSSRERSGECTSQEEMASETVQFLEKEQQTSDEKLRLYFPSDFESLTAMIFDNGNALISHGLGDYGRLIEYAPPKLALEEDKHFTPEFRQELSYALKNLTGQAWTVDFIRDRKGKPSFREQEIAREEARQRAILNAPIVQAVLKTFPNAELVQPAK
ncbi:MAG: DNA polymerase III subunit gamma/tau [Zymomonas mobilis]|uniref:DNA polymerase III subunit gamma/tau n=1 Tax=Zymomonas mobilis TaxID=542 RepID=A0A542W127_ZYMMB|nr:DNA polymerase III subunit gamma/tau [Zymomonas mobilis]TQL17282.1 DNA polymerase-3 subunit gamma/tau [Zymomonas mobilis]